MRRAVRSVLLSLLLLGLWTLTGSDVVGDASLPAPTPALTGSAAVSENSGAEDVPTPSEEAEPSAPAATDVTAVPTEGPDPPVATEPTEPATRTPAVSVSPAPRPRPAERPVMLVLGDSVSEAGIWVGQVGDAMGWRTINASLGSTTMGPHMSWLLDPFSLSQLVTAKAADDLSAQFDLIYRHPREFSPRFKRHVRRLDRTDMADVDLVVIFSGTNDFPAEKPLGEIDDRDESTFTGSLQTVIRTIREHWPHTEIVLFTPTWRRHMPKYGGGDADLEPNPSGRYIGDYVQAVVDVGEALEVPVLNLYAESGIDASTEARYMADCVHPNAAGQRRIAEEATAFFRALAAEGRLSVQPQASTSGGNP